MAHPLAADSKTSSLFNASQILSILHTAKEHYSGQLLMRLTRMRFGLVFREARVLAEYLEYQLFSLLRESDDLTLTVYAGEKNGQFILLGKTDQKQFTFSKTEHLAQHFNALGIGQIELDVHLEWNQIVEALLVLTFVKHPKAGLPWMKAISSEWNRSYMRESMKQEGYLKFCAMMYLSEDERVFSVEYKYCELFLSRAVKHYLVRHQKTRDHRALFHIAPRVTAIALVLFAGIASLWAINPFWALSGFAAASVLVLAILWSLLHTIGSLQFDREHYEQLIHDYVDQITQLSRIPEANPHLIFRLDENGKVLYANPAVDKLRKKMNLAPEAHEQLMPEDVSSLIAGSQNDRDGLCTVEKTLNDCVYQYQISPYTDRRSIIVTGTDITKLKTTERLLRNLNISNVTTLKTRSKELQRTQEVAILCLAGLAETRDPETGQHLQRTRLYSRALAERLKDHPRFRHFLNESMIEKIFNSTPLHDIGKVGIRDAVLLKPGKLTDEEYEEMKRHTIYGGQALQRAEERLGFDSFLRVAREIAFCHHERWDGKGYPFGKSENEIPIPARLMAIADVYDALVSRRPYKEPFSHEKAKQIIAEGHGTQFDPDVTDAFLEIEQDFQEIAKRYQDANCQEVDAMAANGSVTNIPLTEKPY